MAAFDVGFVVTRRDLAYAFVVHVLEQTCDIAANQVGFERPAGVGAAKDHGEVGYVFPSSRRDSSCCRGG